MRIVKISQLNSDEKKALIRRVKFEVADLKNNNYRFMLIDKQNKNADNYIETTFRSIDEILTVLAGYLLKVGIMVAL